MLDAEERLLYWKWQYWKQGIPAHKFHKESVRDIIDIMSIENAMNEKTHKQAEIQKMLMEFK